MSSNSIFIITFSPLIFSAAVWNTSTRFLFFVRSDRWFVLRSSSSCQKQWINEAVDVNPYKSRRDPKSSIFPKTFHHWQSGGGQGKKPLSYRELTFSTISQQSNKIRNIARPSTLNLKMRGCQIFSPALYVHISKKLKTEETSLTHSLDSVCVHVCMNEVSERVCCCFALRFSSCMTKESMNYDPNVVHAERDAFPVKGVCVWVCM